MLRRLLSRITKRDAESPIVLIESYTDGENRGHTFTRADGSSYSLPLPA